MTINSVGDSKVYRIPFEVLATPQRGAGKLGRCKLGLGKLGRGKLGRDLWAGAENSVGAM